MQSGQKKLGCTPCKLVGKGSLVPPSVQPSPSLRENREFLFRGKEVPVAVHKLCTCTKIFLSFYVACDFLTLGVHCNQWSIANS